MAKKKIDTISLIGYAAILVIFISLVSLGLKLTGYATTSDSSIVNITIQSNVVINFSVNNISFGPGSLDLGALNATLDTLGTVENGNWTPVTQGFIVINEGNTNITVDLKTGKTAVVFFDGTDPSYQYNVSNSEPGSCTQASIPLGSWTDVNITGNGDRICDPLGFEEGADSIRIDVKLVIPSDSDTGLKSDIFTATGTVA